MNFASVGDVQEQLNVLAEHSEDLVHLLPRRPGQKEDRWQQIVAAPWSQDAGSAAVDGTEERQRTLGRSGEAEPGTSVATVPDPDPDRRREVDALRSELESLRSEVERIREDLSALRKGLGG